MKYFSLVVTAMLFFAFLSPVWTEEPAALTLTQCVDIALQQQSDVLQGALALDAANARKTQAKSSYYPQVTMQGNSRVLEGGVPRVTSKHSTALSISHDFYDGGLREVKVKRADADITQNSAALERTKQAVIFNVTRSYLSLLRARQLTGVAESRLEYIAGQRELVQTRVEVGEAAEVDLLPLEAQLANARVDQLSAGNAVRTAAIQLQQAMGLTPKADFTVADVNLPVDTSIPPVDECLTQAKANRAEIKQAQAGVGLAEASVKTTKIALAPRPVISGQIDQGLIGGNDRTYSLNAGFAYNIFNGGNTRAAYDEARANLSAAEIRAAQVVKDIDVDVQEAYLNLTNARERMSATDVSVRAAQRNMAAQDERYKNGLAIPLDLLNAQLELTTANSNAVQARYDYYTALAQLDFALGKQGGFYAE